MFGQISVSQDIAQGATVDINLAPFDRFGASGGKASLYAVAEVVDDLVVTLLFGSTAAITRGALPVAVAAGRVVVPEDLIAWGFGAPNDPITLRVENIDAAAAAFIWAKLVIE